MAKMMKNRRDFLKLSAAGMAGAMISGIPVKAGQEKVEAAGYQLGDAINPAISNLRVVYAQDTAIGTATSMVKSDPTSWSYDNQNNAVNPTNIQNNLDKMAMVLTQKATAAEAWATIFQKPTAKAWADVKVAFKVNTLSTAIICRMPVMEKVADELHKLGVAYSNICIYDGARAMFSSTTATVASAKAKGIVMMSGTGAPDLSTIDIIVGFPSNKGHAQTNKNYTLCLKLFTPLNGCPDNNSTTTSFPMLVGRNLGSGSASGYNNIMGTKSATVPYKTQLWIADTLWGTTGIQSASPTKPYPHMLVMGTLAVVVDYLTVVKVRRAIMGSGAADTNCVNVCLAAFNYKTTDPQWIDALAATNVSETSIAKAQGSIEVTLAVRGGQNVKLVMPRSEIITEMGIYGVSGKLISKLEITGANQVNWSGHTLSGKTAARGTYIFRVQARTGSFAQKFSID